MADLADGATKSQELHTAASLAAIPKYEGESLLDCEGCGFEIPEARREAVPGCTACTLCQMRREALAERFVN